MQFAGDPQAPITGFADDVDDLLDQMASDTPTTPARIDEEAFELGTVMLAGGEAGEPDHSAFPRRAGQRAALPEATSTPKVDFPGDHLRYALMAAIRARS